MRIDRRLFLTLAAAAALPQTLPAAAALPLAELPGNVEAPDFVIADMDGTVRRLSHYRGRPVLIAFWAVWCAPCRRELPALAKLRLRLADTDFAVLSVNLGDSRARVAAFLENHPASGLQVLLDEEKSTAAPWHVRGLPVAYAMDVRGVLRLGAIGERDWLAPEIETQLRALI